MGRRRPGKAAHRLKGKVARSKVEVARAGYENLTTKPQ
jgi:hypothetical protein